MGTVVANWIAYTCAMMFCKPNDQFGKGDIRGVIAPESANNAAFGGALIPTLAFGIPGSTVTALMLAALWAQGVTPGESLLTTKVHLVYLIIWSLAVANIIGALLAYVFTDQIARLGKVHINILAPIILVPIFAGALMSTNSMADVLHPARYRHPRLGDGLSRTGRDRRWSWVSCSGIFWSGTISRRPWSMAIPG